jgi:hypothetical protein
MPNNYRENAEMMTTAVVFRSAFRAPIVARGVPEEKTAFDRHH